MPGNFVSATLLPSILSGILIWLWPRRWTARLRYPQPGEVKRQARTALIVLVFTLILVTLFVGGATETYAEDSASREYSLADVIQYLVVGFAEETLFRGYIQVRWVAALGGGGRGCCSPPL
jgi:membrane protease YdiL (CAAX protease family)